MGEWSEVTLDERGRIYLPNDLLLKKGIRRGELVKVFIMLAVEVEAKPE